ncbi:MAG TPA: alcohol dehydrogenase catalytic domain-containing protein [Candidatus Levybacteria bacterium]|nr:alcohol dehydrogenase catalytic domain-containing protein [Candidatus Levybacteria bacterium]
MKNKIVKLEKVGKIKIYEEDMPSLKEGEVLVEIKAVGICGSDMHYFLHGGLGSFKQKMPMEMGHEAAGIVIDSFDKNIFKKGDRVAIEPGKPCLVCEWCLKGKHNLCKNGTFMGANAKGALATYVIVHQIQLEKMPKSMSFEVGALMEPLGVGLHAVNLVNPKSTKNAAIIGAGPIGLSVLFILKKMGFSQIYMVDKLPYRVKFAKKMGATKTFLFKEALQKIKNITNGDGTTYVFDTGGAQDSVNLCVDIVKTSGTIALVGIPDVDFINYNPHKLRTKEVTIKNIRRSNQTLGDCVKMFSNDKNLEKLITHTFRFEKAQNAFNLVSKYKGKVIKCVVVRG